MDASDNYTSDEESDSIVELESHVKASSSRGKVRVNTNGKRAKRRNYDGLIKQKEKKFMCNWKGCTNNTEYADKNAVRVHIKTAHWGLTYTCEECGKVFNRQNHYASHLKTHSDPDSCRCELCKMDFSRQEHKKCHVEKSAHHARNVEDFDDEKSYYATHSLPDDPFDLNVEETGLEPIVKIPKEIKGVSNKMIDTKEGEDEGIYPCVKQPGSHACAGAFHRLFRGQKGFIKVNGSRVKIVGHHSCNSTNYVYCLRDRKSRKYYYFGQSQILPNARFVQYAFCIRFVSRLRRKWEKKKGRFMNESDPHEYNKWIRDLNASSSQYRKGGLNGKKPECPFYIRKVIQHFAEPGRTFRDVVIDIVISFDDSSLLDKVERWYIDTTNSEFAAGGLNDPNAKCWEKIDDEVAQRLMAEEDIEEEIDEEEDKTVKPKKFFSIFGAASSKSRKIEHEN